MTTKTTTRTIAFGQNTIKISLERGTWTEETSLDGWVCGSKTHLVDRTEIIYYKDGKAVASGCSIDPLPKKHPKLAEILKAGCVACIGGNWMIKADTASAIRQALDEVEAENPKTPEMIVLEQEEIKLQQRREKALDEYQAERRERESHPGWCKRCQDYTWGDCGHR